ncbi:MAG: ATP-binding protein, partial [Pseudomonadota bacterium]
ISVGKMSQVLTNIFINAGQAIKSTGKFGQITISTQSQKDWVEIRIKDDGPGISEENKAKLFNPFFTTKQEGEGTGLGLSISIGIISDHGGQIDVESKLGVGTTFIIRLPSSNQQVMTSK